MHILSEMLVTINNLYSLILFSGGKKKPVYIQQDVNDVKSMHKKEIYANILTVVYAG